MVKSLNMQGSPAGDDGRVIDVSEQSGIVIDADFLFSAEFVRLGDDLLLRGPDGEEILIQGYFAQDPPPPLETAEGARLSAETVDALAVPEVPIGYAQAGGVQPAQAIGEVSTLAGTARVQRADGTRENLSEGDPIFQGDVVSTGVGSELGILFIDDTVFSLSPNSRMVIDELVYNPGSNSNSMGVSLIQGTFVFVTGQVAPSGGMEVETPVGLIGIRGTTVGVQIATFGGRTLIANIENPETGELGSFTFTNDAGSALFSQANDFLSVSSINIDPGVPATAAGQAINAAFGRALNRAVEVQRSIGDSQTEDNESEENPQDEQETEAPTIEQLRAELADQGLSPEQIEQILNPQPLETAAPPTASGPQPNSGGSTGPDGTQPGEFSDNGTTPLPDGGGGAGGGGPAGPDTTDSGSEPLPPPAPVDDGETDDNVEEVLLVTNTPPTLASAGAAVFEGGVVVIDATVIGVSDAESPAGSAFTYNIISETNGRVVRQVGENQFVDVFSFTQADLESGDLLFAHDGNEGLQANFFLTVTDPDGDVSAPIVVPIGVTPVNDPPVLLANTLTVSDGGTVALNESNLDAEDDDNDDGGLIFTVSNLAGGQFELTGNQGVAVTSFTQQQLIDGEVVFVDDGDEEPPVFSVSVSDGEDSTVPAETTIIFSSDNTPPIAEDDAVTTEEDSALIGGDLLADNGSGADGDPDGDPLEVIAVDGDTSVVGDPFTLSSGALLTVRADGTFDYDPNGQFENLAVGETATDSFDYEITDGQGETDVATVTVTITGENDAPLAADDEFGTPLDAPISGQVLDDNGNGADGDPDDSDILTITEVNGSADAVGTQITLASGAVLTLNADGTFDYDASNSTLSPGPGAPVFDSFDYTVSDGNGGSDTAIVNIEVRAPGGNQDPIAEDDAVATDEDTVLTGGNVLAANGGDPDSDPDGDPLEVIAVEGDPSLIGGAFNLDSGALLTLNGDGTFTYDPLDVFDFLSAGDKRY